MSGDGLNLYFTCRRVNQFGHGWLLGQEKIFFYRIFSLWFFFGAMFPTCFTVIFKNGDAFSHRTITASHISRAKILFHSLTFCQYSCAFPYSVFFLSPFFRHSFFLILLLLLQSFRFGVVLTSFTPFFIFYDFFPRFFFISLSFYISSFFSTRSCLPFCLWFLDFIILLIHFFFLACNL